MGDAALKTFRTAAIAALSTSLIFATSAPAVADDVPVDITAPVVESTGLTEGQFVTRTTILVPVVHDDTGIVTLETLVNGAHSRKFTIAKTGLRAIADLTGQANGTEVEITLRAYDAAGNIGERTVNVIANGQLPTATVAPPTTTIMHSGPLTVTVNNLPTDIAKVALVDTRTGKDLKVLTEAPWSFDFTTTPGSTLFVSLRYTDVAGNVGYGWATYQIDDTPPTVSDLTYTRKSEQGQIVQISTKATTKGGTIAPDGTLTAAVTDMTLRKVEWYVDGEPYMAGATSNTRGSTSIAWNDRASTRKTATIEIRATDALDQTTSKVFPVTIDRVGPVVTSLTPAQNALVRGKYFVVDVKVRNPSEVAYTEVVDRPIIANALGGLAIYPSKDGPLKFTWRLVDQLGNETFASRTVIVDRTKPSLKLTRAPANKAKVKGKVKVTASAADKNGIGRVELLINGKRVATDYRAGYAFSINTAKYGKTIKMQLRAYDRAGNYVYTSTRTWRR